MSDTRIESYATALVQIAQAEGVLDRIKDDMYRVARAAESSDQLRSVLNDELIPAERRQTIVESLLEGKGHPLSSHLVGLVIGSGRGRELSAILDIVAARGATASGMNLAEVRSAVALSADQQTRLAAALSKRTGKTVDLKVVVDPSVVGGIVATVGDIVIDGTVRTNLDQLKSRL
jgi:F-type H+-transporting ATPase subunit delta